MAHVMHSGDGQTVKQKTTAEGAQKLNNWTDYIGSSNKYTVNNTATGYDVVKKPATTASGGSGGGTNISPLVSMYQNMLAQQQAARQAAYNTSVAQQKKNHEYSVGQVNAAADMAQYATNLANLAAVNGTAGLNLTQGQAANANNPLYYAYLQQMMERVQQ